MTRKLSNSYFLILMKPLNFGLKCNRNLEKDGTTKEYKEDYENIF